MGGSQFIATANDATITDAINCVPPASVPPASVPPASVPPVAARRHPSRNSVMTYRDNRAIMLFVTVVADNRKPILANHAAHDCIVNAWKAATEWTVGRYVIMPDHVHFFCAPATYPPPDFHRWMKRWKSLAAIAYRKTGGSQFIATANDATITDAMNCVPPAGVPPARNPPLFQRDCWDRQLRTGESHAQKWEYVRNNPVRKGLAANADDWPYQGELASLEWHERI